MSTVATSFAQRPGTIFAPRHEVLSFFLGLTIAAASPPEETANFLRLPFLGSYLLTYFDLTVAIATLSFLWTADFGLNKAEKSVCKALGLIILTRIASLLFASNVVPQQAISVFRYVETLVILVVLANFLALEMNRRSFLVGIILGAVLESAGGLFTFIVSSGENRGIWLGSDNFKIQVFLLLVCCIVLMHK